MGSKSLYGTFSFLKKKPKYGAKKITDPETGDIFDSKLEYQRYCFLKLLAMKGEISNIRRQVEFILIPPQYVEEQRVGKSGRHLKPKMKLVERECAYRADFVYEHNGMDVIEDTKGFKTADYVIKRKLMRQNGNPINEVTKANQSIC